MLDHIVERFLHDAEQGSFDGRCETGCRVGPHEVYVQPSAPTEFVGVPAKRRGQPVVVEYRWPQLGHHVADVFDRLVDELERIVNTCAYEICSRRADRALEDVEI